jgi:heat shock protein HtpX
VLADWKERPETVFEEFYLKASRRVGEHVFKRMARAKELQPSLTVSKLLALLIAASVHCFTLLVALFGISLINTINTSNGNNIFFSGVGIGFIILAFCMRPRVNRVPQRNVVSREHFPTLYKLADEVAAKLGTKRVDLILINTEFNASFYRAGWIPKNVLCIGMPLLQILAPQERVALIGHELAHSANGDWSRSFFVGSAIDSLTTWRDIFPREGVFVLITLPISLFLFELPKLVIYLLVHLLMSDSQRAEYLADHMASRAGGTSAALSTLRKLHMTGSMMRALDRFYEMGGKAGISEVLRRSVEAMPSRELERISRMERLVAARLDATHPPTVYRMELLKARPVTQPEVAISDCDNQELERELSGIMPEIEEEMLGEYRSRMGY